MISKSESCSSSLEMTPGIIITGYISTKPKVLFAYMCQCEILEIHAQ